MPHWAQIVRQHSPIVWQTALRLLGNEPDAADCLQETFLAAMRVAERQDVANWPGMLQRVATARALDLLRRRLLSRSRHAGGNDFQLVPSPEDSPVDHLQNDELAQSLANALARLPPRQAEAYCLRHLNELSYEEIARELDVSVDTIGADLHRARTRLRELLSPSCTNLNRGTP
jgi:RNA polymerase sigma factor (sigma-70 family)